VHLPLIVAYALLAAGLALFASRGRPVLWMPAGAAGMVLGILVLLFVTDGKERPMKKPRAELRWWRWFLSAPVRLYPYESRESWRIRLRRWEAREPK
jgi:hypothetical protein